MTTQTRVEMDMFDVRNMCKSLPFVLSVMELTIEDNIAELIPESHSHVFNAGAPVWGVDWCPIHTEDRPCNPVSKLHLSMLQISLPLS